LGLHISFQETHLGFLSPSLLPHQNLRSIAFIWRHKPRGNLKQAIENVGIAYATDFLRISFSLADRSFSNQPWIHFHTLSFKYLKAPLLERPTSDGIPKYFSLRVSECTWRHCFTPSLITPGHRLLKKIDDLSLLIH
jgi:hypothetical protein